MAVSLSVSVQDAGVKKLLSDVLRKTGDLRQPMSELGLYMVREAGRRLRERTAKSDDSTGALRASLTFRAGSDQVTVGSNLVYAAVQQLGFGAPGIRAKPPLKRIAIPLLPNLRRRHIWPRDLPKDFLKLIVSKKGQWILMGPASGIQTAHEERVAGEHRRRYLRGSEGDYKEKDLIPWFLLVKASVIPARPFIAFDAAASKFLKTRLMRHRGLRGE